MTDKTAPWPSRISRLGAMYLMEVLHVFGRTYTASGIQLLMTQV
jgi:hypothetical protein